eukprot:CAMPEP_0116824358 /NCGR_PEP_ID=MMETSP0418-20121206/1351_1 /TAXON_ID=1158023 /ORGANISM="Astrosyne radiata, Strain 13vi08-1A" /LENGTH=134 /DNA_ID=CAMNT_0004452717 /DNA_START=98 /DNA_END=502 /DNA_ORIENTATION=+
MMFEDPTPELSESHVNLQTKEPNEDTCKDTNDDAELQDQLLAEMYAEQSLRRKKRQQDEEFILKDQGLSSSSVSSSLYYESSDLTGFCEDFEAFDFSEVDVSDLDPKPTTSPATESPEDNSSQSARTPEDEDKR